jgi:hypothetical protein
MEAGDGCPRSAVTRSITTCAHAEECGSLASFSRRRVPEHPCEEAPAQATANGRSFGDATSFPLDVAEAATAFRNYLLPLVLCGSRDETEASLARVAARETMLVRRT